jgi:hypothetical protein
MPRFFPTRLVALDDEGFFFHRSKRLGSDVDSFILFYFMDNLYYRCYPIKTKYISRKVEKTSPSKIIEKRNKFLMVNYF